MPSTDSISINRTITRAQHRAATRLQCHWRANAAKKAAAALRSDERRWAAEAGEAAVALMERVSLPSTAEAVTPFLQELYDAFEPHAPAAASVHSKCLDIATPDGSYYGIYSLSVPALRQNKYSYHGVGKGFVAGTICPAKNLDGDRDWRAREITDGKVEPVPCYRWHGDDLTTGKPYDVTTRPWYRHAVERGAGFTEPYADPTSGEGLVSFVAPLRERAGGPVVGVVIAGSFLDPRGDAKRAAEI